MRVRRKSHPMLEVDFDPTLREPETLAAGTHYKKKIRTVSYDLKNEIMKKLIKIDILLIFLVLGYACQSVDKCKNTKIPNYVLSYTMLSSIKLGNNYNYLHIKEPVILIFRGDISAYYSRQKNPEKYSMLNEKHGDHDFNQTVCLGIPPDPLAFIGHDFVDVEIVSDSDYDELHAVGSSLGDLSRFLSVSPYPYIQSRYTNQYPWEEDENYNMFRGLFSSGLYDLEYCYSSISARNLHPINKLISDLLPEDLILLGDGSMDLIAGIFFDSEPTLSKTHTFTVSLTTDDGKVFSNSITMTFE